jgi:hypothetical protein
MKQPWPALLAWPRMCRRGWRSTSSRAALLLRLLRLLARRQLTARRAEG